MSDLARNGLNHLDAGGADAHHADAFTGEVERLARPARGVEDAAAKALLPGEALLQRGGQHAAAADQETRIEGAAAVGADHPAAARLVIHCRGDGGAEADVASQLQPLGDVVHPAFDLRLAGIALAPGPVLVQPFIEQVLVDVALRIELCARVAVPVPGAAHVGGGVDG
eukprot:ctg_2464.g762